MKILLAKGRNIYYLLVHREFSIVSIVFQAFLVFLLLSITFQSNVIADIKEKSAQDYRIQGYAAQQKGNLQEALSLYAKAVALGKDEENAPLYNDMGVIYEELGLSAKAEESYFEALRINSGYLPSYSNLAHLYQSQGDEERAAEFFKKRIELGEPEDTWTQRAKEDLSKLAKHSPQLKRWLIRYESNELSEQIIKQEREDFSNRLTRADELYKKGQALYAQEKYDQAVNEYRQALNLTPKNPKIIKAYDKARLGLINENVKRSFDAVSQMLDTGDVISAKIEIRKLLATFPNEPIQISK